MDRLTSSSIAEDCLFEPFLVVKQKCREAPNPTGGFPISIASNTRSNGTDELGFDSFD